MGGKNSDMSSSMMMESSSMMMDDSTSTMMMESSSTMMEEATSTMMMDSTSTASAYNSYNTMSYGSGSMNWGSSGYNDCVQQCIASFGAPMATYTPPPSNSYGSSMENSGSGSTHTVIVAPMQGVLRYVPFAVNASVGDTIKFEWHANTHTVTKSSVLEICNKTSDAPFTSGIQNDSFVFTQVVNSTDPVFFYCGVPTHCQKGMFGIINPPNALTSSSSVDSMMPGMISNSSGVSAMNTYAANLTSGSPMAASWGNSIDMSSMPAESYSLVAENVLYTRAVLGANPDFISSDGSVNVGSSGTPMVIPQDLSAVTNAADSSSSSTLVVAPSSAAPSATGVSAASSNSNGARGLSASTAVAGFIALAAAVMVL